MRSLATLVAATGLLLSAASAQTTKVIFIGDKRPTNNADPAILAYLQNRYGKANVTYQDTEPAKTVTASTVLGYDVAVLSSTPSSGRYRNILHNSPTPIVNMEEAVADNNPGEFSITTGRTKEVEPGHSITITTAHPITAGFTLNKPIQITKPLFNTELWWSTGVQAAGAKSLAQDDDTKTNLFITYVDVGDTLLDNRKAECRRVMFGMTDASFNFFTPDGMKLFGQAIDWAADGCCAQWSNYGKGLAGKNGIPNLVLDNLPKWGTTVNLSSSNTAGRPTAAVLLVGKQPISVQILGGTLLVSPTLIAQVPIPVAGLTAPWSIPDQSVLCGRVPRAFHEWYFQMLHVDLSVPTGFSFTPGLRVELGK